MLAWLWYRPNARPVILVCALATLTGSLSGCASSSLDATTAASLANIQMSNVAPKDCRYLSETVSFHISHKGYALDVFDTESQIIKMHGQKLRLHAKKINANYVHTVFERNTGLANVVYISAYYQCGGAT